MKFSSLLFVFFALALTAPAQVALDGHNIKSGSVPDNALSANVLLKTGAYSLHTSPTLTNSSYSTTVTVTSVRHIEIVPISESGGGARVVNLATTGVVAGSVLYLRVNFLNIQGTMSLDLFSGASSGTFIAYYATSTAATGLYTLYFDGTLWNVLQATFPAK
jgi:hypothetical protein